MLSSCEIYIPKDIHLKNHCFLPLDMPALHRWVLILLLACPEPAAPQSHGASISHYHSIQSSATVQVQIPLTAPSNSTLLSKTLMSFSIEGDRWADWTGRQQRNQFFYNALMNLHGLTGQPPSIRVGGNSEDRTTFSSSVQVSGIRSCVVPCSSLIWLLIYSIVNLFSLNRTQQRRIRRRTAIW